MGKLRPISENDLGTYWNALKKGAASALPHLRKRQTYISSGVTLHGDLITDEHVVIGGRMLGKIHSTKNVSLGPGSHFEGTIESEHAVISGYVKGHVQTKQTLVVRVPATIIGDLISTSVQVESGVVFQGKIFSSPSDHQAYQNAVLEKEQAVPEKKGIDIQ